MNAKYSCPIQGTFRAHSGNIQGTFREHSGFNRYHLTLNKWNARKPLLRVVCSCMFQCVVPLRGDPQPTGPNRLMLIIII
jgi:hypothetical protein